MNPNIRTRGGYTPLMISAQHDRKNLFNLLLKTYGADPNLRDYSGRKAEHYLVNEDFIGDDLDGGAVNAANGTKADIVRTLQRKAKLDRSTSFLLKELLKAQNLS